MTLPALLQIGAMPALFLKLLKPANTLIDTLHELNAPDNIGGFSVYSNKTVM